MYCLNGSPDLYTSTTCCGKLVPSKDFACCVAPKALAVIPRTKKTAAIIRLPEVFLIIISALIDKMPLIAVSKFNIYYGCKALVFNTYYIVHLRSQKSCMTWLAKHILFRICSLEWFTERE